MLGWGNDYTCRNPVPCEFLVLIGGTNKQGLNLTRNDTGHFVCIKLSILCLCLVCVDTNASSLLSVIIIIAKRVKKKANSKLSPSSYNEIYQIFTLVITLFQVCVWDLCFALSRALVNAEMNMFDCLFCE